MNQSILPKNLLSLIERCVLLAILATLALLPNAHAAQDPNAIHPVLAVRPAFDTIPSFHPNTQRNGLLECSKAKALKCPKCDKLFCNDTTLPKCRFNRKQHKKKCGVVTFKNICATAGCTKAGTQLCKGCYQSYYCSKEHHRQNWKHIHKKECSKNSMPPSYKQCATCKGYASKKFSCKNCKKRFCSQAECQQQKKHHATMHLKARDYNEAIKYQKKTLQSLKQTFGPYHPLVATSYNNLGTCLL